MGKSVFEVLSNVDNVLELVRRGYGDLVGERPESRVPGYWNLATWGRSVTFTLQNLRGPIGADVFDKWYDPQKEAMIADPVMRHFVEVRNEVLKEGQTTASPALSLTMDGRDLEPLRRNPPEGASGFFIGDRFGGSGWEIILPDGSKQKLYVQLPASVQFDFRLIVDDPPSVHRGQPIKDQSIQHLAKLYLAWLEELVAGAHEHFGQSA